IFRWLLTEKVSAQAGLVERRFPQQAHIAVLIREQVARIEASTNGQDAMVSEARAADLYWRAWAEAGAAPTFARNDADKVPPRWRSFTTRSSPLANGGRMAVDPINAALNLGYGLLESATTVGL